MRLRARFSGAAGVTLLLLLNPLFGQNFRLANLSNQRLDELQLFEQRDTVVKQVRDLCSAGNTGSFLFNVAAEVCQEVADQTSTDWPNRAKVIRAGDNAASCSVDLSCAEARFMWDGWDYDEPKGGEGSKRTVCDSGCDYRTLQDAVDASRLGDLIELKPETFGGPETATIVELRDQFDFPGYCPTYTVIRTAGYEDNFSPGRRVAPADAKHMANLVGGDRDRGFYNSVIRMEAFHVEVTGVDRKTDELTTDARHGFSVGDRLVWLSLPKRPYSWIDSDAKDFDHTKPYYVQSAPTPTTLKLSETSGGPAVDITAVPTFGSLGLRKANRPVACWKLQGLEVQVPPGEGAHQDVISLRDHSPLPETQASHNIFEHLYIHGQDNMIGPQRGIYVDGRYIAVRDSLITEISSIGSSDSTALALSRVPGPVLVENNGLSATSINLYVGGMSQHTKNADNGSMGGIVIRNNYHWKKDDWYVLEKKGVPSGACHIGSQYKDTVEKTCYTCTTGTWGSADATCNNFVDYTVKNLWETKSCSGCLTENLWAELSPYGDRSQLYWYVVKSNSTPKEWHGANDVILKNFRSRYTASGPLLRGVVSKDVVQKPTGPVVVWNGLSTEVDPDLYQYQRGATSRGAMSLGGTHRGLEIRHLTQVGSDTTKNESLFVTKLSELTPSVPMRWLSIKDSILAIENVFANGTKANCPSLAAGLAADASAEFEGNVIVSDSALDFSPCSMTEYRERKLADVGFSGPAANWEVAKAGIAGDHRAGGRDSATDGKAVGVDSKELWDGLGGRNPQVGRGSWSEQYGVSVTDVTLKGALIEFERPTAANSCALTLFTNYARTAEHEDTKSSGGRADNRAGNTVAGGHVAFQLGTRAPLAEASQYWFEIDCAKDSVLMVGSFVTPGSSGYVGDRAERQPTVRESPELRELRSR